MKIEDIFKKSIELDTDRLIIRRLTLNDAADMFEFEDDIPSQERKESGLESDELNNYKAKAEFYVRQHQHNM